MMDKKLLLLQICDQLVGKRDAAQQIIDNRELLTDDDVDFLLGRFQRALTQVKHEEGQSGIALMSDLMKNIQSKELESSLKEGEQVNKLLDDLL